MTKLTPTERASKGGQASTHRPFRDKPGAASAAGKSSWANLTPEERSARAKKASDAAAASAPWLRLTAEERSARARKASMAALAKRKKAVDDLTKLD